MKQRILICLHDFHRGGTERTVLGLARDWAEAGRDVTILCGSTEGGLRDMVDPRITVVTLDPPVRRGFLSRLRLARAMAARLDDLGPHLIFLPGNFHALLANGLRRATAVPIVLKISNPPAPALPFAAAVFRALTRGVSGFAAMSRGLACETQALVPGRKVVAMDDPIYVQPAPSVPKAGQLVAWIGRLEPQKNPLLALEVMAALPDLRLVMLGQGSMRDQVLRAITAKGLQDRVTLQAQAPAIAPFLAPADLLLVTSRYEGGPSVAVEALAQGVPVVSTDCSLLLHDLLVLPEAGRIVPHNAAALAEAVRQVRAQVPAPDKLKALAAPFDHRVCAMAYLDWFDSLDG